MAEFMYITLREQSELLNIAAEWFHSKWGVPKEAYLECMEAYLKHETELGWFLCLDGEQNAFPAAGGICHHNRLSAFLDRAPFFAGIPVSCCFWRDRAVSCIFRHHSRKSGDQEWPSECCWFSGWDIFVCGYLKKSNKTTEKIDKKLPDCRKFGIITVSA